MNKKRSLMIGLVLLTAAVLFVAYALHHPEASFPWSNRVTFILYGVYLALLFKFLVEIPFAGRIKREREEGLSVPVKISLFSILALVFLGMALIDGPVGGRTVVQAFIVFESCDLLKETLLQYRKSKKPTH